MQSKCEIKQQPEQPVLVIRTRTAVQNLPQVMGQAFGQIGAYLGMLGEAPAGPPFTAYYNMDMQNLDLEIGFPTAKTLDGKDDIESKSIPAGKYASTMHFGPYDQCEPAYNLLEEFVKKEGEEPTGVAIEYYLNDPNQVKPEQLQTMIVFPLK